jgi:hypothetical protein
MNTTTNPSGRLAVAVMMNFKPDANLSNFADFCTYRAQLREKLLAEILINGENEDHSSTLVLEFSGSGDSGSADNSFDDDHLNHFMMHLMNTKVTGDWYNNDGGGGTITWDLHEDEILIESYYNVQEQVSFSSVKIDKDNQEDTFDPDEEASSGLAQD